jgi:hypothetical protein
MSEKMTMRELETVVPGEIFAKGELPNSPEGIYMTDGNLGRTLRWLAVKGHGYDDWAIYCGWADTSWGEIRSNGDKVAGKDNIQKCVPCDDDVFKRYRY